ncbi:MAG: glutathione S-transferase [Sphingomonas sp. 28-62-20]|uniref:glutathione S-transferase family protein n=1 Tax=Sphingomonas sp. 28-62-20 TaxID=1970433 RepID=UPI000BDD6712|nr:MAG: glutathione S-transferase [Sphingomonas sp. 28-62-20]
MLTIWGRLNSHNVKKVAWLADEIGLDYVRHDVGGQFGMDAAYCALNPNALIPTIEDDGFVLWESNAILRYLGARYAPALWPADPAARAMADRWMDWQFGYADTQRGAFINLVRKPPEMRDANAIARSAAACARQMAILNDALSISPWLSGAAFGLGDIPMGVYAHTWFTLAIDRPPFSALADWYARLITRPAYAQQVMIPLT